MTTRTPRRPQVRVDVTGADPNEAHRLILEHFDQVTDIPPTVLQAFPADVLDATDAHQAGFRRILIRHAPEVDRISGPWCSHPSIGERWPCPDYRDAAAGYATGLEAPR